MDSNYKCKIKIIEFIPQVIVDLVTRAEKKSFPLFFFFSLNNWHCHTRQDGDENLFDLLCQNATDSLTDAYEIEENSNILPDELKCVDPGVKYRSPKEHELAKIKNLNSADLCRTKCSETDGCLYWTWIQKRKKMQCKLMSGIKTTGFRKKKNTAVSGTMLNECTREQTK